MSDEYLGIYAMMLANLKMNYQILSILLKRDNEILRDWRTYINDIDKALAEIKGAKNEI